MRTTTIRLALAAVTTGLLCACVIQLPQPTPTPTPPTPSPTATAVVLSGQGVAGSPFGTAVADVESTLRSALGAPTQVTENTGCPLNPLWTKVLRWEGLTVTFQAESELRTEATALTMWQLRPPDGVPSGAELADNMPLTPTFDELTTAYPGTKVTEQLGWYLAEPTNGITYLGENATSPSVIQGGPLQWCE